MTRREALVAAVRALEEAGCPSPRVDAEHLLAHVLGLGRTALALELDRELREDERANLGALVERRAAREPLAYILGEWGFRRLTLRVDRRVLIPRPETEIVVERCLALLGEAPEPEVLDVGAGSGAIALALADEHPGARVTAFDRSREALEVARQNLAATGLEERVRFVEHDLSGGFGERRWDLVVSNPPYVRGEQLEGLEPEVRDWEPRAALVDEGATGEVARAARRALVPRGWLVLEVADGRSAEVAGLLEGLRYREIAITSDLGGTERVVEGRVP